MQGKLFQGCWQVEKPKGDHSDADRPEQGKQDSWKPGELEKGPLEDEAAMSPEEPLPGCCWDLWEGGHLVP